MSLGPNDRCWCGSELKYKKCHRLRDEPVKRGAISPERPVPDDIVRPPYIANGGIPPTRSEATGQAAGHRQRDAQGRSRCG